MIRLSKRFEEFLRTWRENYRWPLKDTRISSEKRIIQIETLMRNRILKGDLEYIREDLSEIVIWKAGDKHESQMLRRFEGNTYVFLMNTLRNAISILSTNADNVASAMSELVKMKGVGIPVASAFLRFLDPTYHRYGIIDSNVAVFLNHKKITNFDLREGDYWIKKYPESSCRKNIKEYQKYHSWIQSVALDLQRKNVTYADIKQRQQPFTPVDIDMAIFAFMTQNKGKNRIIL